jgi:mono/diheme cytochrome c family protein
MLIMSRTAAIAAAVLIAAGPWQPTSARSPAAASAGHHDVTRQATTHEVVAFMNATTTSWPSYPGGEDAGRADTIWDGVYTAEQARRGQDIFNSECSYCHRDDLTGGFFDNGTGRAPALAGPGAFGSSLTDRWKELAVGDMVADIASAMPQQKPASLTLQAYVDVVSYLLSKNGVPAGTTELPTDLDVLRTMLIVPKPK